MVNFNSDGTPAPITLNFQVNNSCEMFCLCNLVFVLIFWFRVIVQIVIVQQVQITIVYSLFSVFAWSNERTSRSLCRHVKNCWDHYTLHSMPSESTYINEDNWNQFSWSERSVSPQAVGTLWWQFHCECWPTWCCNDQTHSHRLSSIRSHSLLYSFKKTKCIHKLTFNFQYFSVR